MEPLLFLVHRIPYPPNKGDKVRSFNILKHLARDYEVFLGAFIDDPADVKYADVVGQYCRETCLIKIKPARRKVKSLTGLLSGEPLALPYYRHTRMRVWVHEVLSGNNIRRVMVYSSAMAQYVLELDRSALHRVIDFVDVDSEKWVQYSERHRWPMSWLYGREGRELLKYERRVASQFDASILVTEDEATLFRKLAPECAGRIMHMCNGVDTEFFSPQREYPNPYPPAQKILVFTGAMDYWANADAVSWFAREVWPAVRVSCPDAGFYIVGARPSESVRRLASIDGVHVTGAVKEIRPYLAHAVAAVAPLRVARGMQNKVLEAMAMAKPVLATKAAMDGIGLPAQFGDLIHDDPSAFAASAVSLLERGDGAGYGASGRQFVLRDHAWTPNLEPLTDLLKNTSRLPLNVVSAGSDTDQSGSNGRQNLRRDSI